MLRKSCFHKFTSFINKWTFKNKMWVDSRKGCKGQCCGWRLARSCGIFSINLNWYVGDQIIIIYTFFLNTSLTAWLLWIRSWDSKASNSLVIDCEWQSKFSLISGSRVIFIILWNEILNVCALIRVTQQSNVAVTAVRFLISEAQESV